MIGSEIEINLTETIVERYHAVTQSYNSKYNLRMDKIKTDFQLNDIIISFWANQVICH